MGKQSLEMGKNYQKKVLLFSHEVVSDSCDPMDCSLLGSSCLWDLLARILEWVAISFSKKSFTYLYFLIAISTCIYQVRLAYIYQSIFLCVQIDINMCHLYTYEFYVIKSHIFGFDNKLEFMQNQPLFL